MRCNFPMNCTEPMFSSYTAKLFALKFKFKTVPYLPTILSLIIKENNLIMPLRDRRYENIMQFIFGAILWLIVLYAFAVGIARCVHHLIAHYFSHNTP